MLTTLPDRPGAQGPVLDMTSAAEFIEALYGEALSEKLRTGIFTLPDRHTRHFASSGQAAEYALARATDAEVYFHVGLAGGNFGHRSSATDIAAIAGVWADIDLTAPWRADKPLPATVEEACRVIAKLPFLPTVLVESGHGLHAYWLFKEPWVFESGDEQKRAMRAARGWHKLVSAVAAELGWFLENLGDLARVLRLPGTINHKDPANPVEVRVLDHHEERRYNPDDFEPYMAAEEETLHTSGPASECSDEVLARAVKYLEAMPEAVSGQGGHSATYAAATVLVHGFGLPPERALDLLIEGYNPRCRPPWSEKELRHKVEDAAKKGHSKPYGWLRDGERSSIADGVDLSAFMAAPKERAPEPSPEDPGPMPAELLRVPGFVSEVMDHNQETAPYPNQVMAFCGALVLQAVLAGRKVRDAGDNRTNLYVLGLANSGAGKDWPRKVNQRILVEAGLPEVIGDTFASGEGLEDRMFVTPAVLFQNDEIDGLVTAISKGREVRYEGIMNTLLKFYTSAAGYYPMRVKAGKDSGGVIDQPCLCVFGTAIPKHYYEALNEKMLINGFFARMLILEAGKRSAGQESSVPALPESILSTTRHWADLKPGGDGNLTHWHPVPKVVPHTAEAKQALAAVREHADEEYSKAEKRDDDAGMAVWARANEKARRLALIYACSENHLDPVINGQAAEWAGKFVDHQTRRMLFMASEHVSESEFAARCNDLIRVLREWKSRKGDQPMPEWQLNRKLKWKPRDHADVREALMAQERIDYKPVPTKTKPQKLYWLLD